MIGFKSLIIFLLLTLTGNLFAKKLVLLRVSSDIDTTYATLGITVDENDILQGFYYRTFYHNNILKDEVHYAGSSVNKIYRSGLVLKKMKNWRVIILKSSNLDHKFGGRLEINFLSNGLIGSRGKSFLTLKNSPWRVLKEGRTVKNGKVYKKSYLDKLMGIKEIRFF